MRTSGGWGLAALALAVMALAGCEPPSAAAPGTRVFQVHLLDGFADQTVDVRFGQTLLYSGRPPSGMIAAGALIDIPDSQGYTPDIRVGVNGRWFRPPLNFFQGCRAELRFSAAQGGRIDSRMVDPCLAGPRLPGPTYRDPNYSPAPVVVTPTVADIPVTSQPVIYAPPTPLYTPPPAYVAAPVAPVYTPAPAYAPAPVHATPLPGGPGTMVVIPSPTRPGDPVPLTDPRYVPMVPSSSVYP